MKTICVYHISDLDGKCSAAIVRRFYETKGEDIELYGINYGWKVDWDRLRDREVVLVDFSFQPMPNMVQLIQTARSVIWIDHHKSAIEESQSPEFAYTVGVLPGIREVGKGACELTWRHFFGPPHTEAVWLLSKYDVWDNKDQESWKLDIMPFQYGMRVRGNSPENDMDLWRRLLDPRSREEVQKIKDEGINILKYQRLQDEMYCKASAFPTTLGGHPVIAVNRALGNSQLFDSVWNPEKYDMMVTFSLNRANTWNFHLYTTHPHIDCAEIAKSFGGGGHKGASGFISPELPDGFRPPQQPQKPAGEEKKGQD